MKWCLNKRFYNLKVVLTAIKDFDSICEIQLINDSIELEITPKQNIPYIEYEFSNYCLGLMKNNLLV